MEKQINIPNLRFPEFNDEWKKKKLGEVAELQSGFAFKSECFSEAGNKLVIPKNFTKNGYGNFENSISKFSNENPPEKYKCVQGDLLLLLTDLTPSCELLGKPLLLKSEDGEVWLNQRIVRLDINDTINRKWILGYLLTEKYHKIIKETASGSTVRHSSNGIIQNIEFSFPTLPEQTKIASFLTAVDEKLQALTKKKSLLEQYKKGIMQQLFSQELRFKDDNGKDFPDWEEKKLGEITTITTGSSNREDSILDGEFTFFDRSQDIRTSNRYLFDKEAIIVPGEGQEFIPKYFKGKFDLHQRTYAIFDFKDLCGKFLFYYISFNDKHLQSHAVGSTVKSLRLPMFETMLINRPCIDEQNKIAHFLSAIDDKINAVQQQIEKTEVWKKGLLQKMFV